MPYYIRNESREFLADDCEEIRFTGDLRAAAEYDSEAGALEDIKYGALQDCEIVSSDELRLESGRRR